MSFSMNDIREAAVVENDLDALTPGNPSVFICVHLWFQQTIPA
jgi:hypothetical protein